MRQAFDRDLTYNTTAKKNRLKIDRQNALNLSFPLDLFS